MKKFLYVAVLLGFLGCSGSSSKEQPEQTKQEKGDSINEVRLCTDSYYVYKKIYVTDHLGWTHEILVATSGNTMGGVEMLELSVYPEREEEYKE
jgi:hypothetical protein